MHIYVRILEIRWVKHKIMDPTTSAALKVFGPKQY
jgi:hypothetical protein